METKRGKIHRPDEIKIKAFGHEFPRAGSQVLSTASMPLREHFFLTGAGRLISVEEKMDAEKHL